MRRRFFLSLFIIPLMFLSIDSFTPEAICEEPSVRPPAVAGTFYPASPTQLRRMIIKLMDSVPDIAPAGEIVAAVAPHAGYVFSGQVAAYTYKPISFFPMLTSTLLLS